MKQALLIGSPNTGKTTLFNNLTKSNARTANWHGVTVDQTRKPFGTDQAHFLLSDLPGTYSLTAYSMEEQITINALLATPRAPIINVCQSNNLAHNLLLTLELLEFGLNPIVWINQIEGDKTVIHCTQLSKQLGTPVIMMSAKHGGAKQSLLHALCFPKPNHEHSVHYLSHLPLTKVQSIVQTNAAATDLNPTFCAIKLLECDAFMLQTLHLSPSQTNQIAAQATKQTIVQVAAARNAEVKRILSQCTQPPPPPSAAKRKLDKLLLSPHVGYAIFCLVFAAIFYLSFGSVGSMLTQMVQRGVDVCKLSVSGVLAPAGQWLNALVGQALFDGVLSLAGFFGQVVLLFFLLALLEDSGYLSHIAFLWEDWLRLLGLSGKSIYTILLGFGCTTTAILTSRNATNVSTKLKTVLLLPFMSCSAKLPLLLLMCGAFFAQSLWVLVALIGACALLGILVLALYNTHNPKPPSDVLQQLASLRLPSIKRIAQLAWQNSLAFFVRIFGVVLLASVVLWFLQNHNIGLVYLQGNFEGSILQSIAHLVAPLFRPIGLGSAAVVAALISGLVAKEVVVSSIAMLNAAALAGGYTLMQSIALPSSAVHFTPQTAICFAVFCLLYSPCVSAIAMTKKECGNAFATKLVVFQTLLAYCVTLLVYFALSAPFAYVAIPVVITAILLVAALCLTRSSCCNSRRCDTCKQCIIQPKQSTIKARRYS